MLSFNIFGRMGRMGPDVGGLSLRPIQSLATVAQTTKSGEVRDTQSKGAKVTSAKISPIRDHQCCLRIASMGLQGEKKANAGCSTAA